MNWNEKCLLELTHHNIFESSDHRLRFRDLLGCYYTAPFFSKGLCKCMFLACWDETHFYEMLDMLNEMTINGEKNTSILLDQDEVMASRCSGKDKLMYDLSSALLSGRPYLPPDYTAIDSDIAYMIKQTLTAAEYIDDLPDPGAGVS